MEARDGTVLIVGAGLAGSRCAEALRAGGHRGRVIVMGDEPVAPYERPALSKAFLTARGSPDDLALRQPLHWEANRIELATGARIASTDASGRALATDGSAVAWDALVLATGARARRLDGDAVPGAHRLRTLADATALRRDLRPGARLVVVGAGFIGLEVASSARALGVQVTLVASELGVLGRSVGPVVGGLLADRARAAGVCLVTGAEGSRVAAGADGRVAAVVTGTGRQIPCDVALVATGAVPASELAHGLVPIAADGGVATDVAGRTDRERIFACGDVASAWRPWSGDCRSIGHWTTAAGSAQAVAAAILGTRPPPAQIPYSWSDSFGLRLQQIGGPPPPGAELTLDASPDGFEASYRIDGKLQCAVVGNRPQRVASIRRELGETWDRHLDETVDHELATRSVSR
jgi:3-phenylpropionate/trans-cinnamate dioxygenase ferredoxin reductase subunit